MHHDGKEADMVQEGKSGAQDFKLFGDNGAADFDDGELLRGDRAEVGEVLLDLSFGADLSEELDDSRSGGDMCV